MTRQILQPIATVLCLSALVPGCYAPEDRPSTRTADPSSMAPVVPVTITEDDTLQGHLDVADCTGIYGWAHDTDESGRRVNVNIYDGNTKIATVKADGFREDLAQAGKDDGSVMFGYPLPDSLRDSQPHSLQVIIESGKTLTPNPVVVNCSGG